MKSFAVICLSSLLLVSCATVTPDKVVDKTASFDSTTPQGHDQMNSGVLGFNAEGNAMLTRNGVQRYNNLIKDYNIQFRFYKGVELKENDGISESLNKNGDVLYVIDKQHLVYFGVLNSWRRDGREPDSFWDKTKNLVK